MREMTEQEKLSNLLRAGNPEAENFNSADLLTSRLMEQLGPPSQSKVKEIQQEIVSSGDDLDYSPVSTFSSSENSKRIAQKQEEPQKDVRLIGVLRKVHGGLVDTFERIGLNSGLEDNLVNLIDSVGACLAYLGDPTEKFEPLRHLSGLQAPNLVKNAGKVVETTLNCYKIGEVESHKISKDGSEIEIVFSGMQGNIRYKAFGVVSSESAWEGSEAIDYIYTPGSGKMSVKAFEKGRWIDRSDEYSISWTLEENDVLSNENLESPSVLVEEKLSQPEAIDDLVAKEEVLKEKSETNLNKSAIEEQEKVTTGKISNNKKEVEEVVLNNDFDDDEEIGDFPISDG